MHYYAKVLAFLRKMTRRVSNSPKKSHAKSEKFAK